MPNEFFVQRPSIEPTIYVYMIPGIHDGYIKVGYTERDVHTRIKEQMGDFNISFFITIIE